MAEFKPVPAVEKTIQILQTLSESANQGMGVSDIAAKLGYSKGTTYAILNTLLTYNMVEKRVDTNKYSLGSGLGRLVDVYKQNFVLRSRFLEVGRQMRVYCKENIGLFSLRNYHSCIEATIPATASSPLKVDLPVGTLIPAIASSSGKVLISGLPDSEILKIYNLQCREYTDNTVSSPEDFVQMIHAVRCKGYAVNLAEYDAGICSVAAPIFDSRGNIIAAINAALPQIRFTPQVQKELVALVMKYAAELSNIVI